MMTAMGQARGGVVLMEWRKLRSIRSTWWILTVFAAGVALLAGGRALLRRDA